MSYHGSCLCGGIRYTVDGELGSFSLCHCTRCQKANGSAFSAGVTVSPDQVHLSDPHGYLTAYQFSSEVLRYFCRHCGSPLYTLRPYTDAPTMRLRAGTLDTPIDTKPMFHIFYADKAPWFEAADNAPKYTAGLDSSLCDARP